MHSMDPLYMWTIEWWIVVSTSIDAHSTEKKTINTMAIAQPRNFPRFAVFGKYKPMYVIQVNGALNWKFIGRCPQACVIFTREMISKIGTDCTKKWVHKT